jgi:hypothetical protein
LSRWSGTAWENELLLSRHYLGSDGALGAAPLRYIDATDGELARALHADDPEEARRQFVRSFDPYIVRDVFREGAVITAPSDLDAPGYFQYLILTCVVASMATETSSLGDFRLRLAEQLGGKVQFVGLAGIAVLWERLSRWCAARRNAGNPIREIQLSDPGSWVQIGHSLKITFPARRELERMARIFGESGVDLSRPKSIVRTVQNHLHTGNWSDAFKSAFADFRGKVDRGQRLLTNDPFLLAMSKACASGPPVESDHEMVIQMSTNLDGETSFVVTLDNHSAAQLVGLSLPRQSGGAWTVDVHLPELVAAMQRCSQVLVADPAIISLSEGVLAFEEANWGTWRFARTPETRHVRLILHPRLAAEYPAAKATGAYWVVTDPMPLEAGLEILRKARPRYWAEEPWISRPSLADGIRVGSNFLGRPCCMPNIYASFDCSIDVHAAGTTLAVIAVGDADGDRFPLIADGPIEGRWIASVCEDGSPVLDLNLRFVANALEHEPEAFEIDSSRWTREVEVSETHTFVVAKGEAPLRTNYSNNDVFHDVLEAIYAGGAGGWPENEIVPLLGECLKNSGIAIWDALRVLADAGWLEPRKSNNWRSCRWFLKRPRLVDVAPDTLLLDGAACTVVRARFVAAVESAGGRVQARSLPGLWSAPTMVGHLAPGTSGSIEMGLPREGAQVGLPWPTMRLEYPASEFTERSRTARSFWSWARGRFVALQTSEKSDTVEVERLQHNGDRSVDVFRVVGRDGEVQIVESRASVILLAHALARRPLFEFSSESGLLTRTAEEGWLPQEAARYLRFRHLCGPGLIADVDGKVSYVYPANRQDFITLTGWLGPDVVAAQNVEVADQLASFVLGRRLGTSGRMLAARHQLRVS